MQGVVHRQADIDNRQEHHAQAPGDACMAHYPADQQGWQQQSDQRRDKVVCVATEGPEKGCHDDCQ
ncbi:hypothetical protein DJ031_07480 [bacterium endosymbiont of Escarpia laminata]|nr:MAG: hypothetical protein DJ031_07480 [bacterium endosymbiont of Escarpia laminata]